MNTFKTLLVAILFLPLLSAAQRPDREEIESLRVATFTEHMKLSPEESKRFWPVYDKYREEMDRLHRSRRTRIGKLRKELDQLSDQEVSALLAEEIAARQSEASLQKKYHEAFKNVLPVKKVALLYAAEEAFKRELLNRLREGHRRRSSE